MDPLERRVLLALYRNHPDTAPGERYNWKATSEAHRNRDMLLAWAATQPDNELLWCRNLGPVSLAWIRANQSKLDVSDPWTGLREEVDAMNRWYAEDGVKGSPASAWVGYWPAIGWYGGCGYDGEPMEEMADASGETAGEAARSLVRLMREYRERIDHERVEEVE